MLGELASWKNYEEVFKICEFAVLKRPGYEHIKSKETALGLGARIHEIEAKEVDISSSDLRDMVRDGGDLLTYLSEPVISYIKEKGLYMKSHITGADDIKADLEKHLSPMRFKHTIGVMEEAMRLGRIYGEDIEKCKLAGLLHDCAKELTYEQLKWLDVNLSPSQEDLNDGYNKRVLHGKAGRILAKERYGINDIEILDAIEYHITGRPGMGLLEKIIFIADLTEANRKGIFYDRIREELEKGLDQGLLLAFDKLINHVISKGDPLKIETIRARNYYLNKKGE